MLFILGCDENEAPQAVDDTARVNINSNVLIGVVNNDSDSDGDLDLSTVEIITAVTEGTTDIDSVTGEVNYTPDADYEGEDQFTYTIKDNEGLVSNIATVTIEVIDNRPRKVGTPETKPENWYLRIVAEDITRDMKTGDTQLGQVTETDAASRHSLKALKPFSSAYLEVVFRNPPDVANGDYKSNFHMYEDDSDTWEFIVKTDEPNADIILSWRGLYVMDPYIDDQSRLRYREYRSMTNPLIKYMKLVDVSTGTEIPAMHNGEVQTYTFNMDGTQEKVFRWVVQSSEVNILAPKDLQLQSLKVKALRKDATLNHAKIMKESADSFEWGTPPEFEVAK